MIRPSDLMVREAGENMPWGDAPQERLSCNVKGDLADRPTYFSFNSWLSLDEGLTLLRNPNRIARG